MSNIDRKLATVRRIAALEPIPGADLIEVATVDGWQVVVKKGEFSVGQLAIYFEIDSWIPIGLAPFLRKHGSPQRFFHDIDGERLRTVKLRGQISQGLLLPLEFEGIEGEDLTELFNIQKWEKPFNARLTGDAKGNFPSFIPRTDQERIQNCFKQMSEVLGFWEVTEKLDGSSMTVYVKGLDSGVCSRNLDLKWDDNNSFWRQATEEGLIPKIQTLKQDLAFQGELIGPGIQGNPYLLTETEFHCFDIWDIEKQKYLSAEERVRICNQLNIRHVRTLGYRSMALSNEEYGWIVPAWKLLTLIEYADGPSLINPKVKREGVVFKNLDNPNLSFKVISNQWLLKEKD